MRCSMSCSPAPRARRRSSGRAGCFSQLTKWLVERAMEVELTDHLGYEPYLEPPGGAGNARNGTTPKTLITEQGAVRIDAPRDRAATFEPQIVRKRQRRFESFDEKILALYARGLSTLDIEAHLGEIYGVKVGRDLISKVTDAPLRRPTTRLTTQNRLHRNGRPRQTRTGPPKAFESA
jgi:putative transposase